MIWALIKENKKVLQLITQLVPYASALMSYPMLHATALKARSTDYADKVKRREATLINRQLEKKQKQSTMFEKTPTQTCSYLSFGNLHKKNTLLFHYRKRKKLSSQNFTKLDLVPK
jgi:hypothetical protein